MAAGAAVLCASLLLCLLVLASGADAAKKKVGFYELKNSKGDFSIKVTNWGAALVSVIVPDSKGNLGDVVLGYDTVKEYVTSGAVSGAIVGRVANRIANGRFVLDGKIYRLNKDGSTVLHGGHRGFHKVIWTVKEHVPGGDSPYITLYYHSFDGEQGFPGDLDVYVTYSLSSPPYSLHVHMNATALDKATPVNLASHGYWNLAGAGSGDVLNQTVQVLASRYTPVNQSTMIPTGEVAPVAGTPYDLRAPTLLASRIRLVSGAGLAGFDINYAVDGGDDGLFRRVAVVRAPGAGRAMEVWADQPGVQLYTANWVSNVTGKGGRVYGQYGAVCLETQGYPDAVNHPNFPSQIVRPGQAYKHNMLLKFFSPSDY